MTDDPDDELMDSPLLRALRSPATPAELAGESAALRSFRRTGPGRGRRHTLRVATGVSALVLGMTVTGGVAAAYFSALPEPIQDGAHRLLGPIGVPPGPTAVRREHHRAAALEAAGRSARPSGSASPGRKSGPSSTPAAVPPVAATQAPTPAASPRPSPSPTAAVPPRLTATASRRVVPVHGGLLLSGALTRDGRPLGQRTVRAALYDAGSSTWGIVASGQTASDGSVSLRVGPLLHNGRVRLVFERTTSSGISFTVIPKVTVALTRSSAGDRYLVDVAADGGDAGDSVVLERYDTGTWVTVVTHQLGSRGRTRFAVPVPTGDPVRYRVRLVATTSHGPSRAAFTAGP
jgi:hypothetical protein